MQILIHSVVVVADADLSSSGSQVARARIVDRALPPGSPIHPNKERIILLWTVGGLLLGVGIAFLRAQLDTTFKNGRVVETKLGLPLLGIMQPLMVILMAAVVLLIVLAILLPIFEINNLIQ